MMTTETRNINTNSIFSSDAFVSHEHAAYSNLAKRSGRSPGEAENGDQLRTGVRISGRQGVRISGRTGVRISGRTGVRISGRGGVRISSRNGVRISGRARGVRISRDLASLLSDAPVEGRGTERQPSATAKTALRRVPRQCARTPRATSENHHSV
ncbi:hypothetical protein CDG81_05720 [Actinopolyspora erythraea]|uniref:Uncharacterized protein n=1 Tax=Actinopolyspora erythraea TaxID=414996 RepID=A0A223RPU4_9ACTN|nr:hypothetical protein CDG81_05720 [Actinopolyspora erythraea]